jgi:flagellar protein FlaG
MATISSTLATSLTRLAVISAPRAGDGLVPAAATQASKLSPEASKPASPVAVDRTDANKSSTKVSTAALSEEELARQVHAMQDKMDKLNPALAFVVDKDTGKALIQLTDRATKEVILQFPTEAALQITKALDRFQKGQLVNRTV